MAGAFDEAPQAEKAKAELLVQRIRSALFKTPRFLGMSKLATWFRRRSLTDTLDGVVVHKYANEAMLAIAEEIRSCLEGSGLEAEGFSGPALLILSHTADCADTIRHWANIGRANKRPKLLPSVLSSNGIGIDPVLVLRSSRRLCQTSAIVERGVSVMQDDSCGELLALRMKMEINVLGGLSTPSDVTTVAAEAEAATTPMGLMRVFQTQMHLSIFVSILDTFGEFHQTSLVADGSILHHNILEMKDMAVTWRLEAHAGAMQQPMAETCEDVYDFLLAFGGALGKTLHGCDNYERDSIPSFGPLLPLIEAGVAVLQREDGGIDMQAAGEETPPLSAAICLTSGPQLQKIFQALPSCTIFATMEQVMDDPFPKTKGTFRDRLEAIAAAVAQVNPIECRALFYADLIIPFAAAHMSVNML